MDEQKRAIAQACLEGAYDNTMSFPETVQTLHESGFEGYLVDYRQNTCSYYLASGETLILANPQDPGTVSARFNQPEIAAAIKWAQSKSPDYRFVDFSRRVTTNGCAGYLVSFLGRRVVYFGRTGETHVEHLPAPMGSEP